MKNNLTRLLFAVVFLAITSAATATTTWYVNGVSGSDSNNCTSATTACKTIGHAISLATSGDMIKVAAAIYTENLTIGISLTIIGAGSKTTIVDGSRLGRVFSIFSGTNVVLSGITVRHGASGNGGGIQNSGRLTLRSSTVSGNGACCSQYGAVGGGLSNLGGGILTINNSTITANSAYATTCRAPCLFVGGGIFNNGGTLNINNSTIAGNIARTGGAIYSMNNGVVRMNNNTVSGNTASPGAGGVVSGYNGGTATIQNSILANNAGRNCFGTIASNGYNLSSDGTCPFSSAGDLNNTDPMLGPLQYNGGPTQTMALPSGSPAVDAGNPSGCTDNLGHLLKTDQRGKPRPDTEDIGGCDIGAYERQSD